MKTIKINGSYEMNFVADYLNIYFNLNNKFDTYEELEPLLKYGPLIV